MKGPENEFTQAAREALAEQKFETGMYRPARLLSGNGQADFRRSGTLARVRPFAHIRSAAALPGGVASTAYGGRMTLRVHFPSAIAPPDREKTESPVECLNSLHGRTPALIRAMLASGAVAAARE